MWRARMRGSLGRGRRRREPPGPTSREAPAEAILDAPARVGWGLRKQAMREVERGASAALDSLRGAPGKASSAARAVAGGVAGASRRALESAMPLADWVNSTTQGLLASARSRAT